ncbi:MAG: hypothetical protein GX579_18020 [Chloroflexi bacterium]|nr:hypothetical protein [Chloroflexota bacterium]
MDQENLLQNPGLGEDFGPYRNDETLQTAAGWAPWWLPAAPGEPSWKNCQPVFDAYELDNLTVQRVSSPFATHTAGLWQQVPAAPGNRYELTALAQAWSSEDEKPGSKREASDVNVQIGIDPTGGLDPSSPLIVWSDPAQPLSYWGTLRLVAEAQANTITIYLRSAPSLPKRQQSVFWHNVVLLPEGHYKRNLAIVGPGDTYINLLPEEPEPEEVVEVEVSAVRNHPYVELAVRRPDRQRAVAVFGGARQKDGRAIWRYTFSADMEGLYDIRFVADRGARLLAQRLVRVSRQMQLVPSGDPRLSYRRVYVLMPPTATEKWIVAAARGSYAGRHTIGFSADDAGIGDLEHRHVIAVNPHHWPGVLTASWFRQNYPGVKFTPVVANSPEDLEAWLRNWTGEE